MPIPTEDGGVAQRDRRAPWIPATLTQLPRDSETVESGWSNGKGWQIVQS